MCKDKQSDLSYQFEVLLQILSSNGVFDVAGISLKEFQSLQTVLNKSAILYSRISAHLFLYILLVFHNFCVLDST